MQNDSPRDFFLSLPLSSRLLHSLRQGSLGHGWIVSGATPDDLSKFSEGFLDFLFCSEFPSMPEDSKAPCGVCDGCKRRSADTAFIKHLRPDLSSRSYSILVESVRDFQKAFDFKAPKGSWKVGVISDTERMNEQSQNAFLKTLEEPHGNTMFLLLTPHPQSLLSTIISRCRNVNLNLDPFERKPVDASMKRLLPLLVPGGGSEKAILASAEFSMIFRNLEKQTAIEAASRMEKIYLGQEDAKPKKREVDNLAAGLMMKSKMQFLDRIEVWFAALLELTLDCPSLAISLINDWQVELPQKALQELQVFAAIDALQQFKRELSSNLAVDAAVLDFTTKVCRRFSSALA